SLEVAGDEPAEGVADEPAVLSETPVVVVVGGGEDVVDDGGQDRHVVLPHRGRQREVDGGVLQRREPSREDGLGEGSDEVAASGGDGRLPLLIGQPTGAVPLIQGVQASV